MSFVRLIHWNPAEARKWAQSLWMMGYRVDCEAMDQASLRAIKDDPPDVVVIDLSRLPAQGRDLGLTLRKAKATRQVPLVFVDGEPGKVDRIKELLPDATYTMWDHIYDSLNKAIATKPAEPVVPKSVFEAYAGTPLQKKLGIKSNAVVALVNAPEGFEAALGDLPEGAKVQRGAHGSCDLVIWFTSSSQELDSRIEKLGSVAGRDGLWVVWPKKASGIESDLSQAVVRKAGLAAGLVDYKICAIDDTWSGLRFTRRKAT
ncbi:MAG: DUF3052 family protein [Fidelibacterota bacterium]|nr:MAG: DUF3052 family protein [Candidatus Neomarinimicrobiota bacterium]